MALAISIGFVTFGVYKWLNNKNKKVSPLMGLSQSDINSKVLSSTIDQGKKNEVSAQSIKNLDGLKQLDEQNQLVLGPIVMQNLAQSKEYERLLEIANYLADKGGAVAIVSLKYCYSYETDSIKKSSCLTKLNQEARKQKIIQDNDTLPDSYLTIKEGQ